MKYFAKISSDYWSLKNKAHKLAREYAKKVDSTLLHNQREKEIFESTFKLAIHKINKENPRSKDLKLHIWNPTSEDKTIVSIDGNFTMEIHAIKHDTAEGYIISSEYFA